MGVRATSKATYTEITENGQAKTQAGKIYRIVQRRANMSISEIQRAFEKRFDKRIEKSSISGRLNELKESGFIREDSPRPCIVTGNKINPVYAV